MTRFAAPTADPHALRAAARRLAQTGDDLDRRGAAVATATVASTGAWTGTASLQALARTRELRRSAGEAGDLLERMSHATARYADEVEEARQAVARLESQWQDGADRARRRAAAAAEAAAQDAREAVARGEERVRRSYDDGAAAWHEESAELERRYEQVNGTLVDSGWSLERALQERDPIALLPGWVAGGAYTVKSGVRAWGLAVTRGTALARYSSLVLRTGRWFSLAHPAVRGALLGSAEAAKLREVLHGVPRSGFAGGARTAMGRAFLPLTLVSGGLDAYDGGGYGGVRGAATRAAGLTGALGAGALMASGAGVFALGPVGLAVAGAAVIGYGLYSVGSFVYDHREQIGEFLGRTARAASDVAAAGRELAGRAVSTVAAEARDRLASGVATGRRVLDVVTSPAKLLPSLGGLF